MRLGTDGWRVFLMSGRSMCGKPTGRGAMGTEEDEEDGDDAARTGAGTKTGTGGARANDGRGWWRPKGT